MKTTTTRTAIRYYAHLLKVCGYENTEGIGIVHYSSPAGCSELWFGCSSCLIDRESTGIFIDKGMDEVEARITLVDMCKEAIARVEHLN